MNWLQPIDKKLTALDLKVENKKYIGRKYTITGVVESYTRNCLCTAYYSNFAQDYAAIKETIEKELLENGNREIALEWLEAISRNKETNIDIFTNVFLVLDGFWIVQLINDTKIKEHFNMHNRDAYETEENTNLNLRRKRLEELLKNDPKFPIEITWPPAVIMKMVNLVYQYQPSQKSKVLNFSAQTLQWGIALFSAYSLYLLIVKPRLVF